MQLPTEVQEQAVPQPPFEGQSPPSDPFPRCGAKGRWWSPCGSDDVRRHGADADDPAALAKGSTAIDAPIGTRELPW
jgi:hypothetical protein